MNFWSSFLCDENPTINDGNHPQASFNSTKRNIGLILPKKHRKGGCSGLPVVHHHHHHHLSNRTGIWGIPHVWIKNNSESYSLWSLDGNFPQSQWFRQIEDFEPLGSRALHPAPRLYDHPAHRRTPCAPDQADATRRWAAETPKRSQTCQLMLFLLPLPVSWPTTSLLEPIVDIDR